jgi:hypothetical protein
VLRRSELWLALTVFLAAAYFHGGASWNQNARLDAIFTFVEPGPHRWTFRIDPFLPLPDQNINTGDWSLAGGHYYANKAPGTLLLGAAIYLPLYALEVALGASVAHAPWANLNSYLINLGVSVLPLSAALVAWSRQLSRHGSSKRPRITAILLPLLVFFATALFPYATQLWGHTTSAAFVLLALCAFGAARGGSVRAALAVGGCTGLAVLCDFLALPSAFAIALAIAILRPGIMPWLIGGATGPLLLLLGYQWYCFGHPLQLPTEGTNEEFVERERWLGMFGSLSGDALFQLTFGQYRGLFLQMPLLLAVPVAGLRWWRRAPRDALFWICSLGFLGTLLWVASFNGWHGGASVCARYLIVALPLLGWSLVELLDDPRALRIAVGLGLLSALNMLAVAAVSPLADARSSNPLMAETHALFWSGVQHPHTLPIRLQALEPGFPANTPGNAWNFGDLLGLGGILRVLPWLGLVGLSSACALRAARRGD